MMHHEPVREAGSRARGWRRMMGPPNWKKAAPREKTPGDMSKSPKQVHSITSYVILLQTTVCSVREGSGE